MVNFSIVEAHILIATPCVDVQTGSLADHQSAVSPVRESKVCATQGVDVDPVAPIRSDGCHTFTKGKPRPIEATHVRPELLLTARSDNCPITTVYASLSEHANNSSV